MERFKILDFSSTLLYHDSGSMPMQLHLHYTMYCVDIAHCHQHHHQFLLAWLIIKSQYFALL